MKISSPLKAALRISSNEVGAVGVKKFLSRLFNADALS
tara:strand:- start:4178 stop:4291 length:114 start_codon:yes stop_codon:yes gene_type:complete